MTNELTPVLCGCGGEAIIHNYSGIKREGDYTISCSKCRILTDDYPTEAEAITAWNKAMGGSCRKCNNHDERTAKAEYSFLDSFYFCDKCGRVVQTGDCYCCGCGAKLDWSENDGMDTDN